MIATFYGFKNKKNPFQRVHTSAKALLMYDFLKLTNNRQMGKSGSLRFLYPGSDPDHSKI